MTVAEDAKRRIDEYVQAIVDRAPPLTAEQVSTLRPLFGRPADADYSLGPADLAREKARLKALHVGAGVYFALSGDLIKIGHSGDVIRRLANLRTGAGLSIELIHVIPEPDRVERMRLERELHDRFALWRRSGEWFAVAEVQRYALGLCRETCGAPE